MFGEKMVIKYLLRYCFYLLESIEVSLRIVVFKFWLNFILKCNILL